MTGNISNFSVLELKKLKSLITITFKLQSKKGPLGDPFKYGGKWKLEFRDMSSDETISIKKNKEKQDEATWIKRNNKKQKKRIGTEPKTVVQCCHNTGIIKLMYTQQKKEHLLNTTIAQSFNHQENIKCAFFLGKVVA